MNKPHVKLDTSKQNEPAVKLKFNYGFADEEDEYEPTGNYVQMAARFRLYLNRYRGDIGKRISERDTRIKVPQNIDYIHILFQSQFVISKFYEQWFNDFGLMGVQFSKFNTEILFAVSDKQKFQSFLENIENFIAKESGQNRDLEYPEKITFIRQFKLLTTADILQFETAGQLMNFKLVNEFPLGKKVVDEILSSLQLYLNENNINYSYDADSANLEIQNASEENILTIAQNFDIILNVTSSLATVIRPSNLNIPERTYGFEVGGDIDNLPTIGIIDTGISNNTPLSTILIDDESFNLTNNSPFIDNVNHGTAVAALAALGKRAYENNYRDVIQPDAKLLSLKVLDTDSGFLSQKQVINLLNGAKSKYPDIKIFVLTICYQHHKLTNEDYSSYAFELDKFAYMNDCLLFICTANNDNAAATNDTYNLNHFHTESSNLCTPADSMNNVTVGAAAGSLRNGAFGGISISKEFPTLYSRKSHINLALLFSRNKINKCHFKPDIIDFGGDYEFDRAGYIGSGPNASMELLSANNAEGFYKEIGTSFSTPLVANTAAQIQRLYPDIKAQSIKAMIINSASLGLIRFPKPLFSLVNKTSGHGLNNDTKGVYSNENLITFLIEEEIEPETVKIFPINFPKYLIEEDLGKERGLLKVSATLCFSFLPILNYQLAYCPVHIAFGFFKNQSGDDILKKEAAIESYLKSTVRWSQSGRHISKPIPYCNTQKISFVVNRDELINENSTFKIAVNCKINPQLLPGTENSYKGPHLFSIAISIEENLKTGNLTGKLYDGLIASNEIENISTLGLEVEGLELE